VKGYRENREEKTVNQNVMESGGQRMNENA